MKRKLTETKKKPHPHFLNRHLVARVVEELQPLVDVLGGAEQVEQLLVVDLQQGNFDWELCAVLRKLLKDLVQRSGDDSCQRVLKKQQRSVQFLMNTALVLLREIFITSVFPLKPDSPPPRWTARSDSSLPPSWTSFLFRSDRSCTES